MNEVNEASPANKVSDVQRIVMRHIPDAILAARKIAGYSQGVLAKKIGVHVNSIFLWEAGKASPDVYKFAALCAALRISPNSVIGFDELAEIEYLKNELSVLKSRIANAKLALSGYDV